MAGREVLLFVSFVLALWIPESSAQRCAPIAWDSQYGADPVQQHQGKVVLVSLMKGYCGYCVHQAQLLQTLYNSRHQLGLPDLEMVIVNGGEEHSASNIDNLRNVVSFDVLQDSPDNYMYDTVFGGQKDDTIIFDRCGQRAFHIPFPYSNLAYNITERLIRYAHEGEHFCYCRYENQNSHRSKRSIHDTTNGDTSSNSEIGNEIEASAAQFNFMDCSVSDVVCQRFQNIFNRMNMRRARGGANQNSFETRFGAFVDQSDFNLENVGPGFSDGSRMGGRGSRGLRGRNHPSRQRQRLGLFTNV